MGHSLNLVKRIESRVQSLSNIEMKSHSYLTRIPKSEK